MEQPEEQKNIKNDIPVKDQYKKLSAIQHVLARPDTYIGNVQRQQQHTIFAKKIDKKEHKIYNNQQEFSEGFINIFLEILYNARDQIYNDVNADTIEIEIDQSKNTIQVINNGNGIPVEKSNYEGVYIPELIFCYMFSSSNFRDNRKTGGKNGIGAKSCNIYSKSFEIETVYYDKITQIYTKYYQKSSNNLTVVEQPIIQQLNGPQKTYTKIKYEPDLERFNMQKIYNIDMQIILARSIFCVASNNIFKKNTKLIFNNQVFKIKSLRQLYQDFMLDEELCNVHFFQHEQDGWEVLCVLHNTQKIYQIGITNGILNQYGGTHIEYIQKQVIDQLKLKSDKQQQQQIQRRFNHRLGQYIKNNMTVLVSCCITDPIFDSQTKNSLKTDPKKYNPQLKIDDQVYMQIQKSDVIKQLLKNIQEQVQSELNLEALQKSDVKKNQTKIKILPNEKITDAYYAGKKPELCYLYVTEGDSASSFVISGMPEKQIEYTGIFCLGGKIANYKKYPEQKTAQQQFFISFKKVLGLHNKNTPQYPRYQNIIIATDQDDDGKHITGLLLCMLDKFWPELIQKLYIKQLITPNVTAMYKNQFMEFFSYTQFLEWQKVHKASKVQYFKGLGSSEDNQCKRILENQDKYLMVLRYKSKETDQKSLELAFGKQDMDKKKQWLIDYDKNKILDYQQKETSIDEFIHYDFIHFCICNISRGIPCIMDGLKVTQRKILFTGQEVLNTKEPTEMIEFSGDVMKIAKYHHGDASLHQTTSRMAQKLFNNIPLLYGKGQFGNINGNQASKPRYIAIMMKQITKMIYDFDYIDILNKDEDEIQTKKKHQVPLTYKPCIPMILVNGGIGIGSGFSTTIAQYNIITIINVIKNKLKQDMYPDQDVQIDYDIQPDFAQFNGDYVKSQQNGRTIWCAYPQIQWDIKDNSTTIYSLRPYQTYEDYKKTISLLQDNKIIVDIKPIIKPYNVQIQFWFNPEILDLLKLDKELNQASIPKQQINEIINEQIITTLQLKTKISSSNMYLLDENKKIKKYENLQQIFEEYYREMIIYMRQKKQYKIDQLQQQIMLLKYKVEYIKNVLIEKINFKNISKEQQIKQIQIHEKDIKYQEDIIQQILQLQIKDFQDQKIDKLNKIYEQKDEELQYWLNIKEQNIWMGQLLELEEFYIRDYFDKQ